MQHETQESTGALLPTPEEQYFAEQIQKFALGQISLASLQVSGNEVGQVCDFAEDGNLRVRLRQQAETSEQDSK